VGETDVRVRSEVVHDTACRRGDRQRRCGRELAPQVTAPRTSRDYRAVCESAPFRSAPIIVRVERPETTSRARCSGNNPDLTPPHTTHVTSLSGASSPRAPRSPRIVTFVTVSTRGSRCARACAINHIDELRPCWASAYLTYVKRSLSVIDRSRACDRRFAATRIRETIGGDRQRRHIVEGVAHDDCQFRECESYLESSSKSATFLHSPTPPRRATRGKTASRVWQPRSRWRSPRERRESVSLRGAVKRGGETYRVYTIYTFFPPALFPPVL